MALIKHAQAQTIAREAVVLDLGDLARQGREFVAQARAQSEKILAEARAERDRILNGAAEKGHAQGYAEGLAKGRKEGEEKGKASAIAESRKRLDEVCTQWSAAIRQFNDTREKLLAQTQRDVLDLALVIAAKVTKRQVQTDPAIAVEQVRAVLELVSRPSALALAVHPEDRDLIEKALPELTRVFPLVRHVLLQSDPEVSRGSVLARGLGAGASGSSSVGGHVGGNGGSGGGGGGEIDASIETQLARIVEALVPGRVVPNDANGSAESAQGAHPRVSGPSGTDSSTNPDAGEGHP